MFLVLTCCFKRRCPLFLLSSAMLSQRLPQLPLSHLNRINSVPNFTRVWRCLSSETIYVDIPANQDSLIPNCRVSFLSMDILICYVYNLYKYVRCMTMSVCGTGYTISPLNGTRCICMTTHSIFSSPSYKLRNIHPIKGTTWNVTIKKGKIYYISISKSSRLS